MIFKADTKADRDKTAKYVRGNITAPYVHVEVSTLGGASRAAVIIKVSLDDKSQWFNGILHNSRYFMMHLGRDGTLEQFSKSYRLPKKFRRTKVGSLLDAVKKINKYIGQVQ